MTFDRDSFLTTLYVLIGLLTYTSMALYMLERHWKAKFDSEQANYVSMFTDRETLGLCLIWPLTLVGFAVFLMFVFFVHWWWNLHLWCRSKL